MLCLLHTHMHTHSYTFEYDKKNKFLFQTHKTNRKDTDVREYLKSFIRKWKKKWPGFCDDASSSILPNISIYKFEIQKLFVWLHLKISTTGNRNETWFSWITINFFHSLLARITYQVCLNKISVNCKSQMGFWWKHLKLFIFNGEKNENICLENESKKNRVLHSFAERKHSNVFFARIYFMT